MHTRLLYIIGLFLISASLVFAQNLTLKVEPQQQTVGVGESFTVTVMIENISSFGSFEFELEYLTHVVQADSAQMGSFLGSTGRSAIQAGPTIDNSAETGKLYTGGFSFGTQPGANGSGVLATIAFTAQKSGNTMLELKNIQIGDINGQVLSVQSIIPGRINVAGFSGSGIVLDGINTDWQDIPAACSAPNNPSNYFPAEVKAVTTDRVDLKEVKAVISRDTLYFYLSFWGGPVWPNFCEQAGNKIYNRGYYHLLLDLDNNPQTGWNTHWYEGHQSTLGYYNSQGVPETDPIGAEAYVMLGLRTDFYPPNGNANVLLLHYYAADVHAIDTHQPHTPHNYIFELAPTNPDTTDLYQFNGQGYDLISNDGSTAWCGHAWGHDFLEYGVALEKFKAYWRNQGQSYLNSGDKVGITGFVETPLDGWGTDFTPRGEIAVTTSNSTELKLFSQAPVPKAIGLCANYPNPFNPETTIEYRLPYSAGVCVSIYDLQGQLVRILDQGIYPAGARKIKWNGRDMTGNRVASGLYFYKLTVKAIDTHQRELILVKKMTLLK